MTIKGFVNRSLLLVEAYKVLKALSFPHPANSEGQVLTLKAAQSGVDCLVVNISI